MASFETPEKATRVINAILRGERLTSVDLSNCGLSKIPDEVFLLDDCLELLNLGGNNIFEIQPDIVKLQKLRILFFAQNQFESIPAILGSLLSLYMLSFKSNKIKHIPHEALSPSIGWLILTDNKIDVLPPSIGLLKNLRKLMLAGNRIASLPDEMSNCRE